MNITLLTNRDFPALLCANMLVPQLRSHSLSVLMTKQVGNPAHQPEGLKPLSRVDAVLQQTPPPLAGKAMFGFDDLSAMAIPVNEVKSVRKEEGYQLLRDTNPDLIISIRFGAILDDRAIAVSPRGVLNLHSGILPDYRGVMATFWAMLNNAERIGTTLHTIIDSGIDTGDIVFVDEIQPEVGGCYFSNVLRLYLSAIPKLLNEVEGIANGHAITGKTQPTEGGYFTYPDDETLSNFADKGYKLADEGAIRRLLESV